MELPIWSCPAKSMINLHDKFSRLSHRLLWNNVDMFHYQTTASLHAVSIYIWAYVDHITWSDQHSCVRAPSSAAFNSQRTLFIVSRKSVLKFFPNTDLWINQFSLNNFLRDTSVNCSTHPFPTYEVPSVAFYVFILKYFILDSVFSGTKSLLAQLQLPSSFEKISTTSSLWSTWGSFIKNSHSTQKNSTDKISEPGKSVIEEISSKATFYGC